MRWKTFTSRCLSRPQKLTWLKLTLVDPSNLNTKHFIPTRGGYWSWNWDWVGMSLTSTYSVIQYWGFGVMRLGSRLGLRWNVVDLNLYCHVILRFWDIEVAFEVEVEIWPFSNLYMLWDGIEALRLGWDWGGLALRATPILSSHLPQHTCKWISFGYLITSSISNE